MYRRLVVPALLLLAACSDDPVAARSPRPGALQRTLGDSVAAPVGSIALVPDTVRVVEGRTTHLVAVVRDSAGAPLDGRAIAWASSADSIATVDSTGTITGVAIGAATITATSDGKQAVAVVTVHDASVYRIAIGPNGASVVAGDTVSFVADPRDAQDSTVANATVRWSSSADSIAAIDSVSGDVVARTAGTAYVIATSGARRDSARVDVAPGVAAIRILTPLDTLEAYDERPMRAVFLDSVGRLLTHGQAIARRTIRWSSSDSMIARVDSVSGVLTGVDRGTVTITARSDSLADSVKRVVVIKYRSLVTGTEHACDLASGGIAWCWGLNGKDGRIGMATLGDNVVSAVPVRVPGGHRFASLSAYGRTTCALTPNGKAWCWGNNGWGMLGRSTSTYQSATPVLVSDSIRFRTISVGDEHVCAIATNDKPYCWGYNGWGQMGTGKTGAFSEPTLAMGGLELATISAGGSFVCGLTPKGEAYCSGFSGQGNLGDGLKINGGNSYERAPIKVVGGLTFREIHASNQYACALEPNGKAWCWGNNALGTLGTASVSQSSSPVAVDGKLTFRSIAAGYSHACGIGADDALYCWGQNKDGQLGNIAAGNGVRAPIRSADTLTVADVSTANVSTGGAAFTCAVASDRLTTLCWGRNEKGQLGNGDVSPLGKPNATPTIVVGQKPLPKDK